MRSSSSIGRAPASAGPLRPSTCNARTRRAPRRRRCRFRAPGPGDRHRSCRPRRRSRASASALAISAELRSFTVKATVGARSAARVRPMSRTLRVRAEKIEQGLEQGGFVRAKKARARQRRAPARACPPGRDGRRPHPCSRRRPLTAAIWAWSGPAGVNALLGQAVIEEMTLVRQRLVDLAPQVQRPEMRAVHFI